MFHPQIHKGRRPILRTTKIIKGDSVRIIQRISKFLD